MAIPSVVQGMIETEDGKVFELDSPKGTAWAETIGSFRFEPSGGHKACTVRREPSGYWYGCRKVAGKVRKKYIGKSSEVSIVKLEEIAKALEVPPVPQINKVAEVAQEVAQEVTQEVTQVTQGVAEVAQDRLTALELDVANLQKAFEALQEALPGKSGVGNPEKLPKVENEVAEELQNELSNLKTENEYLRQKLAESRDTIETLNWRTESLNEQLETVRAENQRLHNDLGNLQLDRTPQHQLYSQIEELRERNRLLLIKSREERQVLQEQISVLKYRNESQSRRLAEKQNRLDELEAATELSDLKQKPAAASRDLPEAADILNQLKSKRKKSKTDLVDLEAILEILEN
jgi:chromosome segregation ATPase